MHRLDVRNLEQPQGERVDRRAHQGADSRLTAYAGQPDPNDGSRLTIRYDLDGVTREIVGQLAHDGKVRLAPSGPLLEAWAQQDASRP